MPADCANSAVLYMRFVETNGKDEELNQAAFLLRFHARVLRFKFKNGRSPYTRLDHHDGMALGVNLGKALQEFVGVMFHAASAHPSRSKWSDALAIVWSVTCCVEKTDPSHQVASQRVCFLMHRASAKSPWFTNGCQLAAVLGLWSSEGAETRLLQADGDWQLLSQILLRDFARRRVRNVQKSLHNGDPKIIAQYIFFLLVERLYSILPAMFTDDDWDALKVPESASSVRRPSSDNLGRLTAVSVLHIIEKLLKKYIDDVYNLWCISLVMYTGVM